MSQNKEQETNQATSKSNQAAEIYSQEVKAGNKSQARQTAWEQMLAKAQAKVDQQSE